MTSPTFVVGTGRCGSTMLSNMLREHPKILSLSEFFSWVADALRTNKPFAPEPMDGRRFWKTVAAITPLISLGLRHRIPIPEQLYAVDSPNTRFSRQTGVPAILVTTLPHLTENHDALFGALEDEVCRWPSATISEHYIRLFGWLADHFGKQLWVERSGGSLGLTERLLGIFPTARFIHIVRDGRDTALSGQAHFGFRLTLTMILLGQGLGVDPVESLNRTRMACVPEELLPFLPEQFDADAFRAYNPPLQICGEIWVQQVLNGLKVLNALPHDRLLTLRYEDILAEPKRQLDTFAAFLGEEFVNQHWSARCAATVRPPRSTWRDLPEEEARALTEVCRPGFEALREAGVFYEI